MRYAFALAQTRSKHLTLIHKTNVLSNAGAIWTRAIETVGAEFPDVETAYCHIDAATIYMVTDPSRFDVIVTDNLFGDIITDLAGAVTGGIVWPQAETSMPRVPTRRCSSPFTGVLRTSPARIADPTAAILSAALLLRHLGREDDAARVEAVVAADLATRGEGPISTTEIGDRITAAL